MAQRQRRLVVVGGGAAGMSAASRARALDRDLEIVVFEASSHVSYGACGIPYLIGGQISRPEDLVHYTPEFFRTRRNILALTRHRVEGIDRGRRTLTVREPGGAMTEVEFDKLVLTTGGRALRPPIPGADLAGVFTLRTLDDAIALQEHIRARQPRRAAIVGGGYIGLEMAEAFRSLGLEVTLVEMLPQVMSTLDPDLAEPVAAELERQGVRLLLGQAVAGLDGSGNTVQELHTAGGTAVAADLVLLAGGVRPQVELAREAGLALGPTGAVQVSDRMATSLPQIWAAGDVAEAMHLVSRRPAYIPLGTTANKQGRVAGENAGGGHARFGGIVGTAVVKVFGLEVARTGLSTREAEQAGLTPVAATVRHASRAGYYPGGGPMTVRLVLNKPTGRVLGAQLVGADGVAKRTDIIASALHAGMTVRQLAELDLAYAPPFSPVWDPVLMAARQGIKELTGAD